MCDTDNAGHKGCKITPNFNNMLQFKKNISYKSRLTDYANHFLFFLTAVLYTIVFNYYLLMLCLSYCKCFIFNYSFHTLYILIDVSKFFNSFKLTFLFLYLKSLFHITRIYFPDTFYNLCI